MLTSRKLLFFIVCLTIISIIIDLPENLPIKTSWPVTIDTTLSSPDIDLQLGPIHFSRELKTRLGLDLMGGTHLILEADMSDITPQDRDTALQAVKNIIDRRINFFGVTEPTIQTDKVGNSYRVIVELPGVKDIDEAIKLIGKTAQLSFREQAEATPSAQLATSAAHFFGFTKKTELTGKHLKRSRVDFDPNTGEPVVALEFNGQGVKLFEEITKRNVGKSVAIFLDNQLLSAPMVRETITGGKAVISGNFTAQQAKNLSISLNAGALPAPVKIIKQRNIGATLGEEAVKGSLIAGILGLIVIILFMFLNYGRMGLIADAALIIYTLLVFALFKLIPVTLTLAGIAGFILSIGMAVDANILIFERMKEELRVGHNRLTAIELGFRRAFPSIRDSNISSLITSGILYWFGTGSVRGFALTLAIGILVSLFSSITVTRTLLRVFQR